MTKPATNPAKYDVVGFGNAIVDVLAEMPDAFLAAEGLTKGTMALIDEARADALYAAMSAGTVRSGGSAANTLAGIASLGGTAAFIGKVRDDQLGNIFRHDMRAVGMAFDTPAAAEGPSTARCLIAITPDGERTMNTYLGIAGDIRAEDVDETLIASAAVTYVEGYLWDLPSTKAAIRKGLKAARDAGRQVAFTLSDVFCVDRHREEFLALIKSDIDVLFANEAELLSLYPGKDFAQAAAELQKTMRGIALITRSEKGCVVLDKNHMDHVKTAPVARVVDTTGAGDLFAAGFLYGYTRGWDHAEAAELGNACAGEIIQQIGARPSRSLKTLAA